MASDVLAPAPAPAPVQAAGRGRARRRAARRWAMAVLFLLPLAIVLLKLSGTPVGESLREWLSLTARAHRFEVRLSHVLMVPLGALVAVFVRLTLGLRVLGPFRSVLLAISFLMTGLPVGLTFLAVVLLTVVVTRRGVRRLKLPYYARVSTTLSLVALVIAAAVLVGRGFGWHALVRAAYFPIVVLTLTAEGFTSTLRREGLRSALWRGAATAALAVLIAGIASLPGFEDLLLEYPELLLAQVGLMLVISEFLGFRLLQSWNPPVARVRRRKKKRAGAKRRAGLAGASPGAAPADPSPTTPILESNPS